MSNSVLFYRALWVMPKDFGQFFGGKRVRNLTLGDSLLDA